MQEHESQNKYVEWQNPDNKKYGMILFIENSRKFKLTPVSEVNQWFPKEEP